MFCMLEMDGMSIEVIVDEVSYTFFVVCKGILSARGERMGRRLI